MYFMQYHVEYFVQDCGNSTADGLVSSQPWANLLIRPIYNQTCLKYINEIFYYINGLYI